MELNRAKDLQEMETSNVEPPGLVTCGLVLGDCPPSQSGVQPSPSNPEFIHTDFTKPLIAEAHAANAHIPRKMDLSCTSRSATPCSSPPSFTGYTNINTQSVLKPGFDNSRGNIINPPTYPSRSIQPRPSSCPLPQSAIPLPGSSINSSPSPSVQSSLAHTTPFPNIPHPSSHPMPFPAILTPSPKPTSCQIVHSCSSHTTPCANIHALTPHTTLCPPLHTISPGTIRVAASTQVLNIPRIPRIPIQQHTEPPRCTSSPTLRPLTPPTAHTPPILSSPHAHGSMPVVPPTAHQSGPRTRAQPCSEEPENLSAKSSAGTNITSAQSMLEEPLSLCTTEVKSCSTAKSPCHTPHSLPHTTSFQSCLLSHSASVPSKPQPAENSDFHKKSDGLNLTRSIVDQLCGCDSVDSKKPEIFSGISLIDKKRAEKKGKQVSGETLEKQESKIVKIPINIKSEPRSCTPSPSPEESINRESKSPPSSQTVPTNTDGNQDEAEEEFVWEVYLHATGAQPAPYTAFKHVEHSLKCGLKKGMKVEVINRHNADSYWVASVVLTCVPLLRLRYVGYEEDSAADFWCDVASQELHPIGWGSMNGKILQPPDGMNHISNDWHEFIMKKSQGAEPAPGYLLSGCTGMTPVDQIRTGMHLEVQHELQPSSVWIACVLENVGGRLLLRYEGMPHASQDFWLFYLHYRLHPIGWASDHDCIYKPPDVILSEHKNYTEWSNILQKALQEAKENPFPKEVFKEQVQPSKHRFQEGWKVEARLPNNAAQFAPATISQVIDPVFVMVEFDDVSRHEESEKLQICCHGGSHDIFPVNWCSGNGLQLISPQGWDKSEFSWEEYLAVYKGEPAPPEAFSSLVVTHEFARGQKLEVVNPEHPGQLCAGTVTHIFDCLLWIHLDSATSLSASSLIVDVESHDIFPVGWCESNGYPLKPPSKSAYPRKKLAVVPPGQSSSSLRQLSADDIRSATYSEIKSGDSGGGSGWCPKIYFNHRCFSGPFLSKGRIAELPRSVGPGPISLVLKEVLTMLINVAYKSSRVLRELQMEGSPRPHMSQHLLKAKYKGKSYRAVVEICCSQEQIEEFCRQICIKLECCPNLCSLQCVNGGCPENCAQLTKTKYTYYYGKKKRRKIGRPPGGHTNLENGPKKPGKRRKRRRKLLHGVDHSVADSEESLGSELQDTDNNPDDVFHEIADQPVRKKRCYTHKVPPPSIIKTRGAKLPRFTFERRTHRKVTLPPSPKSDHHPKAPSPPRPTFQGEQLLQLSSNPLTWSVLQVINFIKTTDCAHMARFFLEQEIDGQALLLMNLPAVQEYLELKLGPAIKLCHHIERVKVAFYEQYA